MTRGPFNTRCMLALVLTASVAVSTIMPAGAQTVSPVIAQYVEQARGELIVENPTSDPMPVSLSVRGFTVDSLGTVHFGEVPEDTKVELAWRSFTLPPASRTVVPYRVRTTNAPAWVVIEAAFLPPRTGSVQTRIVLPHVVYVRQRDPLPKAELAATILPDSAGTWIIRVANLGGSLDRVQSAAWHTPDGRLIAELSEAAPILPHQVRYLKLGAAPEGAGSIRIHGAFGTLDIPLPEVLSGIPR